MTVKSAYALCSVDGCAAKTHAKGRCQKHYARWHRTGSTITQLTPAGAPLAWLEAHVAYEGDDCITWPFCTSGEGRAFVRYRDVGTHASRVMCILAHGDPPTPQYNAAHSCGKGHEGCLNPRHLRWATPKENEADKIIHGTTNRGERHGCAKLTNADIAEIRALKGLLLQREIGELFGVGQGHISAILLGKERIHG